MLTATRLRQALAYDPETGRFAQKELRRWRTITGRRQSGGYIQIMIDRRVYYAHRLVWLYMMNEWPKKQIDHINGIRDDNRWGNLREASPLQNNANRKRRHDNKSGYKGVWLDKHRNRWVAEIRLHGRRCWREYFTDPANAAAAYVTAAGHIFGEFASGGDS